PQRFRFEFPGLLRNTKVLEHAAAGRGLFTIRPGRDGMVRRVPMTMLAEGQTMPSLSGGILRVATRTVTMLIESETVGIKSLGNALTGAVISQPIYGIAVEFPAALLFGLLVIAFAPLFGPTTLVALGAAFATVLIGTSAYFYTQHRLLIDFTYPLMSTTAIYLTLIFSSFVREQAQRRQIRSAFGQYLSPALVEQLAQSPEKLVLGGEE